MVHYTENLIRSVVANKEKTFSPRPLHKAINDVYTGTYS